MKPDHSLNSSQEKKRPRNQWTYRKTRRNLPDSLTRLATRLSKHKKDLSEVVIMVATAVTIEETTEAEVTEEEVPNFQPTIAPTSNGGETKKLLVRLCETITKKDRRRSNRISNQEVVIRIGVETKTEVDTNNNITKSGMMPTASEAAATTVKISL